MKRILFAFLLLASSAFADRDPWENFESDGHGHGGGHHMPVVPEPSTYGVVFMTASTSLYFLLRKKRK